MTQRLFSAFAAAASVSALCTAMPAQAVVTINVQEVGSDVVATTAGTLDLSGLSLFSNDAFQSIAAIEPSDAYFASAIGALDAYVGLTGPGNFGFGGVTTGTGSGDAFVFAGGSFDFVAVPRSYISGAPLAATTTFAGKSFASLGVTPGTYVFNTPADSIIITFGALEAAVPEPSTWAMMLLGFFGIGGAMRSRKRRETGVLSHT